MKNLVKITSFLLVFIISCLLIGQGLIEGYVFCIGADDHISFEVTHSSQNHGLKDIRKSPEKYLLKKATKLVFNAKCIDIPVRIKVDSLIKNRTIQIQPLAYILQINQLNRTAEGIKLYRDKILLSSSPVFSSLRSVVLII